MCRVSDWSLPRTAISVRLQLTTGNPLPGAVFVADRVAHHEGPETLLELLNRDEGFFAFRPEGKPGGPAVLLIAKSQTVNVAAPGSAPIVDPDRREAARQASITVHLHGGSMLTGLVRFEAPDNHRRLLDYLNASLDPFFALTVDDVTIYINRAHVLYARPGD